jgi:hypothetical protein
MRGRFFYDAMMALHPISDALPSQNDFVKLEVLGWEPALGSRLDPGASML